MAGRATENLPGGSLNIPYRIFNQSIYLNVFTVYKHYCILLLYSIWFHVYFQFHRMYLFFHNMPESLHMCAAGLKLISTYFEHANMQGRMVGIWWQKWRGSRSKWQRGHRRPTGKGQPFAEHVYKSNSAVSVWNNLRPSWSSLPLNLLQSSFLIFTVCCELGASPTDESGSGIP